MPTPNHPDLPLCSAFAAQPGRITFAKWLRKLQIAKTRRRLLLAFCHTAGMLCDYQVIGVITLEQKTAMYGELRAFVSGASA